MKSYLDILDEKQKKCNCGIFMPPIEDYEAVDIIKDYLLGEDWYTVNPVPRVQVNAEIVYEILNKYSPKFRKELREYAKRNKPTKILQRIRRGWKEVKKYAGQK